MDPLSHSVAPSDMQLSHMARAQMTAIADFGNTLQFCKVGLNSNPYLSLPYNVDVVFGNAMARDFLAKQLCQETGKNVEVSISEDGLRTVVQSATEKVSSHYSLSPSVNSSPATFTSRDIQQPMSANSPYSTSKDLKQPTSTARTASGPRKQPPRPMNCWLLYRDEKYKQLKQQHPHLTVQQISTICSMDWKKLTVAEKDIWKARANDAKIEHARMFPDYKYAPRKPGQKKKRQSHKAAHAARATALLSNSNTSGCGTNPTTTPSNFNTSSYGTNPTTMLPQFNTSSYGTGSSTTLPNFNTSSYGTNPTTMLSHFNISGYATNATVMIPDINTSGYATNSTTTPETSDEFFDKIMASLVPHSNTTPDTSDDYIRKITESLAENLIQTGTPFMGASSQAEEATRDTQIREDEATRHTTLDDEADAFGDVDFDFFGDELVAFRNGADGSATLPPMQEHF